MILKVLFFAVGAALPLSPLLIVLRVTAGPHLPF